MNLFSNSTNVTLTNASPLLVTSGVTNVIYKGSPGGLTLSGVISGGDSLSTLYFNTSAADSLTTFTLSGANTFRANLRLNRGSLIVSNATALGSTNNEVFINSFTNLTDGNLRFAISGTFANPIRNDLPWDNTIGTGTNDVVLTGNIFGSGGLTKLGTGKLTITGNNTYSNGTTISAGTLQVGNGGSVGTLGSGNINNNGVLIFNRNNSITNANAISGAGSVRQIGSGTTILSAFNTYSGTTIVANGTLLVSGGITGSSEVESGGTLDVTGLFSAATAGPVTVKAGGQVRGTGQISSLSVQSNGVVKIQTAATNSTGAWDTAGTITFDPGSVIDVSGLNLNQPSYTLIRGTSVIGTPVLQGATGFTVINTNNSILLTPPNSAPVASGSATLAAVPKGVQSYVLPGERVGNLFLNNFSDANDTSWATGLFKTKVPWAAPGRTFMEQRNDTAFAALKGDGSVVTWGDATSGGNSSSVAGALSGGVVEIYATDAAFAALKTNGAVVTWGDSGYGGDSSGKDLSGGVKEIFSGNFAFAALKENGSVVTWGNSSHGGDSSGKPLSSGVVKIVSTARAFAALKNDGSVVTWGNSAYGGDSTGKAISSGVVEIFSTGSAFAALKDDGSVVTWGDATRGGHSSSVAGALSGGVIRIFANDGAFAALKADGSVVSWGETGYGGDSSGVAGQLTEVVGITSAVDAFAALKSDGSVVAWPVSTWAGDTSNASGSLSGGVVKIFSTWSAFAALKSDGSVVAWGLNGGDVSGVSSQLSGGVVDIESTGSAFAALKTDGSVVTWGDSSYGGNGFVSGVTEIFGIPQAFAALRGDGSVVAWGDGPSGGSTYSVSGLLSEGVVTVGTPAQKNRLVRGHALAGVAVIGNAATSNGAWQYSTNGFNWVNVPTTGLSDSSALLLDNNAQLRFAPLPNFAGTPGALTVRLIETGGSLTVTTGSTANVSQNGGTSSVSSGTVVLTTSVSGLSISVQPAGLPAVAGDNVLLRVVASDAAGGSLSYQWRKNGAIISGETNSTLQLPSVGSGDAGSYSVLVSSSSSSVMSSNAVVTVNTANRPGPQPIGWNAVYRFQGDYADSSGNANTLALTNFPHRATTPLTFTYDRYGTANAALQMAGGDFPARSDGLASFNPSSGQLSISAWIKYTNSTNNQLIAVMARTTNANSGQWQMGVNASRELFFADIGGFPEEPPAVSTNKVTAGVWQHVAFVRNGTNGTFYINGEASGSVTASTNVEYENRDFTVGIDMRNAGYDGPAWGDPASRPWLGTVDDLAVASTALTADQVLLVVMGDSDGDGFTDSAEVSAGTDPMLASSTPTLPNSAPVASGSATLPAVREGVQSYVLSGERVGNLFLKNFSDAADAARTNGLFSVQASAASHAKSSGEFRNQYALAALKSNGSVVTWGDSGSGGNASGASGSVASGVVKIFSGPAAFAALKSDGSVVTWGGFGGDSSSVSNSLASGVERIFSTDRAFAALKSNGSVVTWGYGFWGGESGGVSTELASGVKNIVSTITAFAALKTNGAVVAWGEYAPAAAGVSNALASGVVEVFTTTRAFAALKSDGSVVTWGDGDYGGDSSTVADRLARGVVKIFPTGFAFAALKDDGSVVTWGNIYNGGSNNLAGLSNGVVSIVANNVAFAALKTNGAVVTWGDSPNGGDSSNVSSALSNGVVSIVANTAAFAALKDNGAVVTWGQPDYGGNSSISTAGSYSSVANQLSNGVVALAATRSAFAALKADGSVVAWGEALEGGDSSSVASQLGGGVSRVFGGERAFAALKNNGSVVTWGNSFYGGNGDVWESGNGVITNVGEDLAQGVVTLASPSHQDRLVSGNALAGVAVIDNAATPGQGTWQYSANGFSWSNIPTTGLSETSALVLDNNAQVRFAPASGYVGTPGSLTVRLIETGETSEVAGEPNPVITGQTRSVFSNGGTTSISATTVALGTSVDGNPPILLPGSGLTGTVEDAVSYAVTATGTAPITFTATGLPTGLSISSNGLVSGTPTTAGGGEASVVASNSYGVVTNTLTWTIDRATPAITVAPTASAITFGQTLAASTLTGGSASVPGTFAFTFPSTQPGAGNANQSVTFTPQDLANYQPVTTTVSVAVNRATPTITWNNPTAITFGTPLSSTQLNASSSVAGSFVYNPAAGTQLNVGTRLLTAVFTASNSLNYVSPLTNTVSLQVNQATPAISVIPTASAITQGQSLASSTLSGGQAKLGTNLVNGAFDWTVPSTVPTGSGPQGVTFTPTDTTNYSTVTTSVNVTVNPANSAPLASGSASLAAVPAGTEGYVLSGETVGNLFLANFSDLADASRTQGVMVTRDRWTVPTKTSKESRNGSAFAALKSDGSVVTWGNSANGGNSSSVASQLSNGVADVVSSRAAFAALKNNGSVVTWGDSAFGGNSSAVGSQLSSGVVDIFSTYFAFAALKTNGAVVVWGDSNNGGSSTSVPAGKLSSGVVKIFSTYYAFAALKEDGSVVTWGDGSNGGSSSSVAGQLTNGVVDIFSTQAAFAALKGDGSVVTWGAPASGGTSSGVAPQLAGGVVKIFSTYYAFAALKNDGSVVTWGDSTRGGDSSTVAGKLAGGVVEIFSTGSAFAALKSDGSVVTWGLGSEGGDSTIVASQLLNGVARIYATTQAFAALKSNGSVVTWGVSNYGGSSTPVASQLAAGVKSITAAEAAFAALKSNGSVVTWGFATEGGDSSTVASQLSGNVLEIFSTGSAFAALKSGGAVVTWGGSAYGGDSSTVASQLSSGVVTLATPVERKSLPRGNALAGVAVVDNAASLVQGEWQYSTDGWSWTSVSTGLSDSAALVLDNLTRLRFVPASGFQGSAGGLTVRLIETGGTTPVTGGSTLNVSVNGGTSEISAQTVTLGASVYNPGTAPQLAVGSGLSGTVGVPVSYAVTATGTAPILFSASNLPAGLSIGTNSGTITGTPTAATNGTAAIVASNSFGTATNSLAWTIAKATQQITWTNPISPKNFGDPSFVAGASASSGLAITYTSSQPGVADVVNGSILVLGVGQTTITANQDGDGVYEPATPVSRLLTVNSTGGVTSDGSALLSGGGTGSSSPSGAAPILELPATMTFGQTISLAGAVQAARVGESGLNLAIPDGTGTGLTRTLSLTNFSFNQYRLKVGLKLSGTSVANRLGDISAFLRYTDTANTNIVTLLDRVGKIMSDPSDFGSVASGLDVVFSDTASSNIQSLDPESTATVAGTYRPASLLDTPAKGLSVFGGSNFTGNWELLIGDLSPGATMNLVDWFIQFEDLSAPSPTANTTEGLVYEVIDDPTLADDGTSKGQISGNQLEAKAGTGRITVRAKYAGGSNWTTNAITLQQASETLTFTNRPVTVVSNQPFAFDPGATSPSGRAVVYTSDNPNVAVGGTNAVSIRGAGITTLRAVAPADQDYALTPETNRILTVLAPPASLPFRENFSSPGLDRFAPINLDWGAGNFNLAPTADSFLANTNGRLAFSFPRKAASVATPNLTLPLTNSWTMEATVNMPNTASSDFHAVGIKISRDLHQGGYYYPDEQIVLQYYNYAGNPGGAPMGVRSYWAKQDGTGTVGPTNWATPSTIRLSMRYDHQTKQLACLYRDSTNSPWVTNQTHSLATNGTIGSAWALKETDQFRVAFFGETESSTGTLGRDIWIDDIEVQVQTLPELTLSGTLTGKVDEALSGGYPVLVSGHPPITFTASNLPTGLTIGSANGLITGTPTAGGIGTATIYASNSFGVVSTNLPFDIARAFSTISMTGTSSFTYNANPQGPVSVNRSGSSGAVTFEYEGTNGTTYARSPSRPTNAGQYTAVASLAGDSNYDGASSLPFGFTIAKATPVISQVPAASAITYGQTLGLSTLTGGAANTGGSFAFTSPSSAPNAGTHSASVTFTPSDSNNFTTATTNVSVTVNQASAPISLSGLTQTYDGTAKSVTVTTTPSGLGASVTYDGSTNPPTAAGLYSVAATVTDPNYSGSTISAFLIAPAGLTITADPKTKRVGETDPPLTYQITSGSLLGADALSGGLLRVLGESVGDYAITSTLSNPNYLINYVGANLTIVSTAPIAGNDLLWADPNPNIVSKIAIAEMLANDSDPNRPGNNSDLQITVNTNSLPAGYGTMRVKGGWVSYQPPPSWPVPASIKTTTFTYLLRNTSNNQTATGTVTVSLTRDNAVQIGNFTTQTNVVPPVVIFSVLPTQRFEVEKTLSLSPATWQPLPNTATTPATNIHTSDANGWLRVPDSALTNTNVSGGFYRLRWAP